MLFRIRFAKYGVVKFIGHLDAMRYFQKAVRRSELPIKYSQGFNPHQLMVFAQPLGVGVTSDGEYMDIETEDADFTGAPLNADRVAGILGGALTEGFEIVSIRQIPWQEGTKHPENAMSLVAGADYVMSLKDGYSLSFVDDFIQHFSTDSKENMYEENRMGIIPYVKQKLEDFMGQESIVVLKKSKSGERDMDIKPYIYEAAVEDNSQIPSFMDEIGVAHADIYEPGIRFFFRLSAGSAVNIKPELVMEAFLKYCGTEFDELAFQIHRAQMYSDIEHVVGL
ncbi:MAG: TIGR03936 family radical SAM-associated protein [Lachnospiraceae bacterium]|nr:TIGR03936 family radical SAM-associated protein [Lachnospiraceae bacterium]